MFVADAHRDDGKRFVLRADEKLTAFPELNRRFAPAAIYSGGQIWPFSILPPLIHATEGFLWFLLLANATELLWGWIRQRHVVIALDSVMGAIFIGFGLKLAFDRAR